MRLVGRDKKFFTKVRHIVKHYLIFYLAKNGDDPIKFRPPTITFIHNDLVKHDYNFVISNQLCQITYENGELSIIDNAVSRSTVKSNNQTSGDVKETCGDVKE